MAPFRTFTIKTAELGKRYKISDCVYGLYAIMT